MINLNPYNLEIGKTYWFKYKFCESKWYQAKITRFTDQGYPWHVSKNESGYVAADSYDILDVKNIQIIEQEAKEWLLTQKMDAFAEHTPMARLMAEFLIFKTPEILQ